MVFFAVQRASLVAQLVKSPPAMQENLGSIPGLGRSPGEGKGYPFKFSWGLGLPCCSAGKESAHMEKEMATHSSVLAWRIPGTAEPGGLPSMRSHRVGHD